MLLIHILACNMDTITGNERLTLANNLIHSEVRDLLLKRALAVALWDVVTDGVENKHNC